MMTIGQVKGELHKSLWTLKRGERTSYHGREKNAEAEAERLRALGLDVVCICPWLAEVRVPQTDGEPIKVCLM